MRDVVPMHFDAGLTLGRGELVQQALERLDVDFLTGFS